MKKTWVANGLRAATFGGLMVLGSASQAQVYGLVHGGVSQIDLSCAGQTPCDRSGSAFGGHVGLKLNDSWAAELGYRVTAGQHAPSNSLVNGLHTHSYRLGVAHHQPFGKDWLFISRVGLANTRSRTEAGNLAAGKQTRSARVVYGGLGVGTRLNKVVSLHLMADFSSAEARFTASNNGPVLNGRGSLRTLTFGVGFNL